MACAICGAAAEPVYLRRATARLCRKHRKQLEDNGWRPVCRFDDCDNTVPSVGESCATCSHLVAKGCR